MSNCITSMARRSLSWPSGTKRRRGIEKSKIAAVPPQTRWRASDPMAWNPTRGLSSRSSFTSSAISKSGEHRLQRQPRRLRQAGHQVHVLHRLPRGALHEIVERRDDDRPPRPPVLRHADEAVVRAAHLPGGRRLARSEEHTSELQSLMRISYAVFCL